VLVFATLVQLGLKRFLRYPWPFLLSLAIDPVVLLLTVLVFTTIYRNNGGSAILGYSLRQMIWYFAASTFVWYWINNFTDRQIAARITQGDLSQDLLRPVSVFVWQLGSAVALRLSGIVLEFVPSLLLYSVLVPPDFMSATTLLRFVGAASVAFLLFFVINFLIGLAGFYLQSAQALVAVKHILIAVAAGSFIPLDFFPAEVRHVLGWSPFPYLFYWPIQFFLGRTASGWSGFFGREGLALAWTAALFLLCQLFWRRAVTRYTGAGG
jgi:ABC-2 type transport system permease protein